MLLNATFFYFVKKIHVLHIDMLVVFHVRYKKVMNIYIQDVKCYNKMCSQIYIFLINNKFVVNWSVLHIKIGKCLGITTKLVAGKHWVEGDC